MQSATKELQTAPHLAQIERGLTTIVRWGNLPRVRERFTAVAGMSLDRASYAVLFRLEEGPARLSDLAQRVGVDISTLSRQVHHLKAAVLVGRSVMEEDRRAALLYVTDKGRDFVQRIRAAGSADPWPQAVWMRSSPWSWAPPGARPSRHGTSASASVTSRRSAGSRSM